jgi:hypothetical protein
MVSNIRNQGRDPEDDELPSELAPEVYDAMLVLERLESLEEEMEELGVRTLDDVRLRITELHRQLD